MHIQEVDMKKIYLLIIMFFLASITPFKNGKTQNYTRMPIRIRKNENNGLWEEKGRVTCEHILTIGLTK